VPAAAGYCEIWGRKERARLPVFPEKTSRLSPLGGAAAWRELPCGYAQMKSPDRNSQSVPPRFMSHDEDSRRAELPTKLIL